jgi:peptidoglycan/LPS O-acetylase OafA/YrhL
MLSDGVGLSARADSAPVSLRHIPSLDGIRALSVLLVFFAHAGLDRVVPGGLGVTIFFFLSGYLITTLLRVEYQKNLRISVRHFWLRRVLRIMPPFYAVLCATVVATSMFSPGTLKSIPVLAQFLIFTNYWAIWYGSTGQPAGTGIFWSLAVEEHFYLVFPWLYIGMRKLDVAPFRQALLLWGICAVILIWRCILVIHFHSPVDRTYLATDTRVDSILFGCALAVWRNPVVDRLTLNPRMWKIAILPSACLLLIFCLIYRLDAFRETFRYTLQGIALNFMFIAAIQFKDWKVFRFLNTRAMAFLGVLSYSLYLVHFPILNVTKVTFSDYPIAGAALALAASVGVAWLMYMVIEKPCARLRRRLID